MARNLSSGEVIKMIEAAGWVRKRTKGSHVSFKHPNVPHLITVPHPKATLGTGLIRKILKQAGIE